MTADIDIRDPKTSVTRDDQIVGGNGVWQWVVLDSAPGATQRPGLPPHWSLWRDQVLSATPYLSDYWATALRTAVTQVVTRQFTVKDSEDSARRLERSRDLLLDFGGPAMYSSSLEQVAQDYFTCDKGAVVELEYEGKTRSGVPSGRVIGLHHLDTLRCWPTGNREFPYLYTDWQGTQHPLHARSVMTLVDMTSPRLGLWGVGRCAASDVWETIVLDGAVQTYVREKVTGSRALALHFVGGVTKKQLADVKATGDAEQERRGSLLYRGALVVPVDIEPGAELKVATVDLAGLPDGFDPAQIQQRAGLIFALALGMPVTDIATLQGGQFGTGTQSQVIDASRQGRGVEGFVRKWERAVNRLALPRRTTVDMFGIDPRDQKAEADVKNAEATYVGTLVDKGIATPQQAANYLADAGHWPQEFAQPDATAGGALTDSGENSKIAGVGETAGGAPGQGPASPLARALLAVAQQKAARRRLAGKDLALDEGARAKVEELRRAEP